MQLAAHEMHDLHELTLSCVNSITNMGYFIQHVQNPELKGLIEKHLPFHIRDYDIKVEYLSKNEGATTTLPIPEVSQTLSSYTTSPMATYPPITPRTNARDFNDREIATAYLLTLKRAGREYAWCAMEMSHPDIRTFCQNAFLMSCNHAYDVWQWMVKQGFYPLEPADQQMTSKVGSIYGIVPPQ